MKNKKIIVISMIISMTSIHAVRVTNEYKVVNGDVLSTFGSSNNTFTQYAKNTFNGNPDQLKFALQFNGDFDGTSCDGNRTGTKESRKCTSTNPSACMATFNGGRSTLAETGVLNGRAYKPRCSSIKGDSYVVMSGQSSLQGKNALGIFTYSGKKRGQTNSRVLTPFNPISYSDESHKGVAGTYVASVIPSDIRPYAFKCGNGSNCNLVADSRQSVPLAKVASEAGKVYQVQQKLGFVIESTDKVKNSKGKAIYPGVEYVPTTLCKGQKCNYKSATLFGDPEQGGRLVVGGAIMSSRSFTTISRKIGKRTYRTNLFSSHGSPTQKDRFTNQKYFAIKITFHQFLRTIMMATAVKNNIALPSNYNNASFNRKVARDYGANWRNRSSWKIKKFHMGQEIVNKDNKKQVYIGGSYKYFRLWKMR